MIIQVQLPFGVSLDTQKCRELYISRSDQLHSTGVKQNLKNSPHQTWQLCEINEFDLCLLITNWKLWKYSYYNIKNSHSPNAVFASPLHVRSELCGCPLPLGSPGAVPTAPAPHVGRRVHRAARKTWSMPYGWLILKTLSFQDLCREQKHSWL